jgi:hypothetical protein
VTNVVGIQRITDTLGAIIGKRSHRPITSLVIHIVVLMLSATLTIASDLVPASTDTRVSIKISLFYSSIALELAGLWCQLISEQYFHHSRPCQTYKRYGAFTLIILYVLSPFQMAWRGV